MAHHVNLGGKTRLLLYGTAAFKLMKRETGTTMADFLAQLATGEADIVSDITYYALRVGERHEKIPSSEVEDYEPLDVAMWIDEYPGGISVFAQHLVDAMPKPAAGEGEGEPGEAQKTGTGMSSKSLQEG